MDPVPLDEMFPTTARIVCVLDPAVLADADIQRLHVARFGKDQTGSGRTKPGGTSAP